MMDNKIKDSNADFMVSCILKLQDEEESYKFFSDLCTVPEMRAMSQRLVVAYLLRAGWVYSDIVEKTGASTATISRVSRSLNYGADGYDAIFDRLSPKELAALPTK